MGNGKAWEDLWWVSYIVLAVWIVNSALIFYLLNQIDTIVNVQLYSFDLQFSKQWADPYWTATRLMMVFLGVPMALSAAVVVAGFSRFRRKAKTAFAKRKTEPAQTTLKEKPSIVLTEKPPVEPEETPRPPVSDEQQQSAPEEQEEQPSSIEKKTEDEQKPAPVNEPKLEVFPLQIIPPTEQTNYETQVDEIEKEPPPKADSEADICCPACGKVFNRPLVTLDFSTGTTRLINVCPFCKTTLGEALDSKNDQPS